MEILKLGADTRQLDNTKYEPYNDECRIIDLSECVDLKEIPDRMFCFWKALEEVILPPNLEKIGDFAFVGSTSLTKINFPETLREIGEAAFNDSGFEIFELPSSLEIIKPIGSLDNLKLLDMSKCVHLKEIPANFLNWGDKRRLIFLPPYLEEIDDMAFQSINYLIVPPTVRTIKSMKQVGIICLSENIESLRGLKACVLNVAEGMEDKYKRLLKKEGLSESNVVINPIYDELTFWYTE